MSGAAPLVYVDHFGMDFGKKNVIRDLSFDIKAGETFGLRVVVVAELWILAAIVLRLAVRLFRYGSIEYSRKLSLREIFSA